MEGGAPAAVPKPAGENAPRAAEPGREHRSPSLFAAREAPERETVDDDRSSGTPWFSVLLVLAGVSGIAYILHKVLRRYRVLREAGIEDAAPRGDVGGSPGLSFVEPVKDEDFWGQEQDFVLGEPKRKGAG